MIQQSIGATNDLSKQPAFRGLSQRLHSLANAHVRALGTGFSVGFVGCVADAPVRQLTRNLALHLGSLANDGVVLVDVNWSLSIGASGNAGNTPSGMARPCVSDQIQSLGGGLSVVSINGGGDSSERSSKIDLDLIVRAVRERFQLVVINLPPVTDARAITNAGSIDGIVLVLESGRTKRLDACRAWERLNQCSASRLGAVVAEAPNR